MLKVDKGEVSIKGRKLDLMAEYAILTRQLIGADILTEDEVDECITLGKKPKEEVEKEAQRIALDFFDNFFIKFLDHSNDL